MMGAKAMVMLGMWCSWRVCELDEEGAMVSGGAHLFHSMMGGASLNSGLEA